MRAVNDLVSKLKPSYITMETYYGNLPNKALRKYEDIEDKIESCGYRCLDHFRAADSGIDYWFFGRND